MNRLFLRRVCGLSLLLVLFAVVHAGAQNSGKNYLTRITIEQIEQLEADGEKILFVDTRTKSQWNRAEDKLPSAVRVQNVRDIREMTRTYPPETPIVTYCT